VLGIFVVVLAHIRGLSTAFREAEQRFLLLFLEKEEQY
jgi:hypothetical protein